jgi:hypothetical protein
MSNKIRAFPEGNLAIPVLIHTANLDKGTLVKISDDNTVDKSTSEDDVLIGSLEVPSKTADGLGTVRTRFRALVNFQCKGAIAAGDRVKAGAAVSTVQTLKKFVAASDPSDVAIGVCLIGGADTEEGTFLIF